jgi:hypothetical protein
LHEDIVCRRVAQATKPPFLNAPLLDESKLPILAHLRIFVINLLAQTLEGGLHVAYNGLVPVKPLNDHSNKQSNEQSNDHPNDHSNEQSNEQSNHRLVYLPNNRVVPKALDALATA